MANKFNSKRTFYKKKKITISLIPRFSGLFIIAIGILIITGVFSRISSALLCIIMLGAIFHVKGMQSLTGDGGIELDLILLGSLLVIMITGPGRISISQIIKKIPRCIH